jgi:hypothetical protein
MASYRVVAPNRSSVEQTASGANKSKIQHSSGVRCVFFIRSLRNRRRSVRPWSPGNVDDVVVKGGPVPGSWFLVPAGAVILHSYAHERFRFCSSELHCRHARLKFQMSSDSDGKI